MSENPHEITPTWSVLYDTYKCAVCNTRIHKDSETQEWTHHAWANPYRSQA